MVERFRPLSIWWTTFTGHLVRPFQLFLVSTILSGCGLVMNWVGSNKTDLSLVGFSTTLSGQVDGWVTASQMSAQATCTGAQAYLFRLNTNGEKIEPAVSTASVVGGKFEFTGLDLALGISSQSAETPLIIQVSGCTELYSRVVTGAVDQRVNSNSTILSSLLNTAQGSSMVQNLRADSARTYASLLQTLERDSTPAAVLNDLSTNLKSSFETLAGSGINPSVLNDSYPFYVIAQVPSILTEGQNATFTATVKHWNSSYIPRIEWRDPTSLLSTQASFVYTPNKNSQSANKLFTLSIGEDAAGSIDTTKPKMDYSWSRQIVDAFPAQVPPTVLASAAITRSSTVYLQMTTGASMIECATFSKIALTEDDSTPPAPTAFDTANLTCTTSNSQIIAYTLPDSSNGLKTIRVWTIDSAGNVSIVPQIIMVTINSAAPLLAFSTPAANSNFNSGITVTGTCEVGFNVTVGGTGANGTQSVTCVNPGTFSTNVTFSSGDGTKTIDISQTDGAGNIFSDSRSFVLDTVAPVTTITSPAANTPAQSGVTLTGACENGLAVILSGSGLQSPNSTTCSSGSYSQAVMFTAGDGTKTITVTQTDLAGNSTSASRDFLKDSTPPALNIASPAVGTSAQASVTLTGNCESGLTISYGGAGILSPFTGACSGGTYSQQVFFSAGDGTKTLSVSQTDAAGNSTTVSRDFVRDNVAPNLTQTSLSFPYYSNTNSVTFGGACESGLTVYASLGGVAEGNTVCSSGSWSYTTVSQTVDATYDYTFKQTDLAGNIATTTGRFIRDTVAPALTFTGSNSQVTASNSVTFSGNCESGLPSPIAVSGGTDTATTTCSGGSWSYTTATQSTDATRTYTFTQTDQAGNATTISATWQRNTALPNLLITTASPIVNNANSAHVDGNCEPGYNISITFNSVQEASLACPGGTFSYDFATQTTDASRTYQFQQTNSMSLSTTQSFTWVRDTTPPALASGTFLINGGATITGRAHVKVSLQATDALSKITGFCLKTNDTTAPAAGDSCWVDVETGAGLTASPTLNLVNFGYNLPIVPDNYSVYAWVRDQVGNTSSLSNGGIGTAALDSASITLNLAIPPTIGYVLIGSTDYPASPPSANDLTAGVGSPIYIKWKAFDDHALPTNPIAIYFTSDDTTWTLVANNLANGQNGACLVDDPATPADNDATGCYKLSAAPTSGYLKFRVIVTDSDGLTSAMSSVGMNVASTLRFLAGNTDPGTGLSAQAGMFFYNGMSDSITRDFNTLAVDRNGVVYFKDVYRGILKVDPTDGVTQVFLKVTGTISGDGGPVSNATAANILQMTLDQHQPTQRLWIFDYNSIRRVDLATGVITTVIGGPSATDNTDNVSNPLNARVDWLAWDPVGWHSWSAFYSLPNGDFYFQAGNDGYWDTNSRPSAGLLRVRYLEASSGQIKSYRVTNVTTARGQPTGSYNDCEIRNLTFGYNPATSAITDRLGIIRIWPGWSVCNFADQATYESFDATGASAATNPDSLTPGDLGFFSDWSSLRTGLDGKIYAVSKAWVNNGIYRFNGTGWTKLLGDSTGLAGYCPDSTDALSCRSRVSDVWVTENGTVYFLDDGMIRTITPSNKVVTLMGQAQVSGIGGPALSARLSNSIHTFRMANDGRITFGSQPEVKFYEIDPSGNLYWIAGDGSQAAPTLGALSTSTGVELEHPNSSGDDFGMDPVTGDIYHHAGRWQISKLTRSSSAIGSTGSWSTFLGGGANNYLTSDGQSNIGFNIDCSVGLDSTNYTLWGCWILPKVLNFSNGKLITQFSSLARRNSDNSQSPFNNMIKLYDTSTLVQTHLLGHLGHNVSTGNPWDGISPSGTLASSADFWSADWSRVATPYNVSGDRWLFSRYADGSYQNIYDVTAGGTLTTFVTLPSGPRSFAYRLHNTNEYIYYCSVGDNRIHRYFVQGSTDTALSWPIAGMSCTGSAMFYHESTQSVTFSYQQNGLMGFAEYLDPMP